MGAFDQLQINGHVGSGANSLQLGAGTDAAATNAIAIGNNSSVGSTATVGIAIGEFADAIGPNTPIAIGSQARCGSVSVVVGSNAYALGQTSVAIGQSARCLSFDDAVAVGYAAKADGDGATALGVQAVALADGIGIGRDTEAAVGTIAVGQGLVITVDNAVVVGRNITLDSASVDAVVLGTGHTIFGSTPIFIGTDIVATDPGANPDPISPIVIGHGALLGFTAQEGPVEAIVIGTAAQVGSLSTYPIAIGSGANVSAGLDDGIALGRGASVIGNNAIAIGTSISVGNSSIGIGGGVTVTNAVVVGLGATSSASGCSIGHSAVGGVNGVAIGRNSSTNDDAVAVGYGAVATGASSIHRSVAVGRESRGFRLGVAVGYRAGRGTAMETHSTRESIAIGAETNIGTISPLRFGAAAIGYQASSDANYGQAIGHLTVVSHDEAIAIGRSAVSTAVNRMTVGTIGGSYDMELQIGKGFGAWGVAPVGTQPVHIPDPTGGTPDAEARTAINAILVVLEGTGLTAAA